MVKHQRCLGIALSALALAAFAGTAVARGSCGEKSAAASNGAVMMPASTEGKDIVATAVSAGQFNTLAAALKAAGLVEALQGKGPFTVFAPTDEAFAKLPKGTVEGLLKPENKAKLQAILKYHVVSGIVTSKEIGNVPAAATLQGQIVKPSVTDSGVKVNAANVVKADIGCTNGVIHVIDNVILPESRTIPALAKDNGSFKTLLAAVEAAGLAETLSGPGPFTVFAPTDEAFAKLPKPVLGALLKPENKDTLTKILTYHVVSGRVTSVDAVKAGKAATLEGGSVAATSAGGKVMINASTVAIADIDAANGVVHAIDTVLIPESVAKTLSTLSMTTPRDVVELAINAGAPMFNHGDHAGCAKVYEVAMTALMAMPEASVSADQRMTLAKAMESGRATHDMGERAWTYRRALDRMMTTTEMTTASR